MEVQAAAALAVALFFLALIVVAVWRASAEHARGELDWRSMANNTSDPLFVVEVAAAHEREPDIAFIRYNSAFARHLPEARTGSGTDTAKRLFGDHFVELLRAAKAATDGRSEPVDLVPGRDTSPAACVSLTPVKLRGHTVRYAGSFLPRNATPSVAFEDPGRGAAPAVTRGAVTAERGARTVGNLYGSHDPLTGLPERRALEQALYRIAQRYHREPPGALLMLDLDHFKAINDTMGYEAGDDVLVETVDICKRNIRAGDTMFRITGDEFVIILLGATVDAAADIAERLLTDLESAPVRRGEIAGRVTCSAGLVPIDRSLDVDHMLRLASIAVQQAKRAGRNRVARAVYDDTRNETAGTTVRWISRLENALEEDRIGVVFQPIVSVSEGTVFAYECLMRLHEPDGAVTLPGEFIGAAEEFGLMPSIDLLVVQKVLARAREMPEVRFFVNLSAATLGNPRACDRLLRTVQESEIDPTHLHFEITETAAVSDFGETVRRMRDLTDIGCHFALDDFGVGFSSFAYLRELPARYIKLDGSFVREIESDWSRRRILQSLIGMCHALDKKVIAEWVESEAILTILREMEADYGQGFFWSRPADALVATHRSGGSTAAL